MRLYDIHPEWELEAQLKGNPRPPFTLGQNNVE